MHTEEDYKKAKEIIKAYNSAKREEKINSSSNPMTWKEAIKKYNLTPDSRLQIDCIQLEARGNDKYYTKKNDNITHINIITEKHVYINSVRWLRLNWKVSITHVDGINVLK